MASTRIRKQPTETVRAVISIPWLDPDELITVANAVTNGPGTSVGDVTIDNAADEVSVLISGGLDGQTFDVDVTSETSLGQIREDVILVNVQDRFFEEGAPPPEPVDPGDPIEPTEILSGNGPPSSATGTTGDYYIDKNAPERWFYGPKNAGEWPPVVTSLSYASGQPVVPVHGNWTIDSADARTVIVEPDPNLPPVTLNDDITLTFLDVGAHSHDQKIVRRSWAGDGFVQLVGMGTSGGDFPMANGDVALVEYQTARGGWFVLAHWPAAGTGGLTAALDAKVDEVDGTARDLSLERPSFSTGSWDYAGGVLTLNHTEGSVFDVPLGSLGGNVTSIVELARPPRARGRSVMSLRFTQSPSASPVRTVALPASMRLPVTADGWTMPVGFGRSVVFEFGSDAGSDTWTCFSGPSEFRPLATGVVVTAAALAANQTVGTTRIYDVNSLGLNGIAPYVAVSGAVTGGTCSVVAGDLQIVATGGAGVTAGTYVLRDAAGVTATGVLNLTLTAVAGGLTATDTVRGLQSPTVGSPVYNDGSVYSWNLAGIDVTGGTAPYVLTAFTMPVGTAAVAGVGVAARATWTGDGVAPATYAGSYTVQDFLGATDTGVMSLTVTAEDTTADESKSFNGLLFGTGMPLAKYGDRQFPADDYMRAPQSGRIRAVYQHLRIGPKYAGGTFGDIMVRLTLKRVSDGSTLGVSDIFDPNANADTNTSFWHNFVFTSLTPAVVRDEALKLEWHNVTSAGVVNDGTARASQNGYYNGTWWAGAPDSPWLTLNDSTWRRDVLPLSDDVNSETLNFRPAAMFEYEGGAKRGLLYQYWENSDRKHKNYHVLGGTVAGRWTWTQDYTISAKTLKAGLYTYGAAVSGNVLFRFYSVNSAGAETPLTDYTTNIALSAFPRYGSIWGWIHDDTTNLTTHFSPRMDWVTAPWNPRKVFTTGLTYRCMITAPSGANLVYCAHPNYRDTYPGSGMLGILDAWPRNTRAQYGTPGGPWNDFSFETLTAQSKTMPFIQFDLRA